MRVPPALKLYVGIRDSKAPWLGPVCCSSCYNPGGSLAPCEVLLDSGAFTDRLKDRLTPSAAMVRQQRWEEKARAKWPGFTRASIWVAYDRLLNHQGDADAMDRINQTIEAAAFFDKNRATLEPRTLLLPCQGATPHQYTYCAKRILPYTRTRDVFGLGGWCTIGKNKRRWHDLRNTLSHILPLVARAGVQRVHIFGVLWLPALAMTLYHCDQHQLALSTDTNAPHLYTYAKRCKHTHARLSDSVTYWRKALATLRVHPEYRR